jgi:uncharacterized protein YecT (DUF1311 family)
LHANCIALALLTSSGLCLAQPEVACNPGGNTQEMNKCAEMTLAEKDRELNQAYRALVQSLKPDSKVDSTDYAKVKKRLLAAQRAWLTFRDNDCTAKEVQWNAFTMRGGIYFGCMIERTEQRTKELRSWVVH